ARAQAAQLAGSSAVENTSLATAHGHFVVTETHEGGANGFAGGAREDARERQKVLAQQQKQQRELLRAQRWRSGEGERNQHDEARVWREGAWEAADEDFTGKPIIFDERTSTTERLNAPGYLDRLQDLQYQVERERRIDGAAMTRSALLSAAGVTSQDAEAAAGMRNEPLSEPARSPSRYIDPVSKLVAFGRTEADPSGDEAGKEGGVEVRLESLPKHYLAWFKTMSKEITREQERLKDARNLRSNQASAFLMLLPADLLAILTIQEMMHLVHSQPQGVTLTNLAMRMGRSVLDEMNLIKSSAEVDTWTELRRRMDRDAQAFDSLDSFVDSTFQQTTWDTSTTVKMGASLVHMLCRCAFLQPVKGDNSPEERIPAFYHTGAFQKGKTVGVVVAHHALVAALLQNQTLDDYLKMNLPLTRPMVCPPRPWTSPFNGGFLTQRFGLLRTSAGGRQQLKMLRNQEAASSQELYDGINALGNVAWTLNKPLFEVAEKVLEMDITFTGRPSVEDDRYRELLGELRSLEKQVMHQQKLRNEPLETRNILVAKLQKLKRVRQEYLSKNLDFRSKVSLANFVSEYDQFWFPYSLDFRGRAYPIPPVSHMGDDLARSLLIFKDKRPLGERGLYWLKVHLANQMGQDKASFDERVAWVDAHLEELVDCAAEPFDKEDPKHKPKMWATAENCWQALSTCMELKAALDSGDPVNFLSSLPVHQDGSCNGLQHYAALGRDRLGGSQVNLVARERPGDVYTAVAERVREVIMEKSQLEVPPESEFEDKNARETIERERHLALKLNGQISRKVVKQTVMTSVYGVTYIGARDQIMRQLETVNDRNKLMRLNGDNSHGAIFDTDDELFQASGLLAKVVLDAIGDTFRSAKEIKEWFKTLGKISTDAGDPISWITPLGLPVVQPYRVKNKSSVKTLMQKIIVTEIKEDSNINKGKQQTAFPPNFIHSIDSTHMLMTASSCMQAGICFTAVHDSYWTHAGDVEAMNEQLRHEFIKLHSQDILGDLYRQFVARYPQRAHMIPEPPEPGDLDLKEVLESKYFFN
ncbi:DNA-directed RNA polymerase, mitochondrial, partial [Hondaea fermentalgiana]